MRKSTMVIVGGLAVVALWAYRLRRGSAPAPLPPHVQAAAVAASPPSAVETFSPRNRIW